MSASGTKASRRDQGAPQGLLTPAKESLDARAAHEGDSNRLILTNGPPHKSPWIEQPGVGQLSDSNHGVASGGVVRSGQDRWPHVTIRRLLPELLIRLGQEPGPREMTCLQGLRSCKLLLCFLQFSRRGESLLMELLECRKPPPLTPHQHVDRSMFT